MRTSIRFALAALLILCGVTAVQAIPLMINYQGVLTDGGGTAITVATSVTFQIWDAAAGGTSLWSEVQSVTPDMDGLFNVMLGMVNAIPPTTFANDTYLGITISPDAEMTPRTRIISVGYAYRVSTVDGATGGAISSAITVGDKATIGSGNTNTGTNSFVAGLSNSASNAQSTVGGGRQNAALADFATVGGGWSDTASGGLATVGGGFDNIASGAFSTVAGGGGSRATGFLSTVGGGANAASGRFATAPGGGDNSAAGNYSFAAGHRAKANHAGSFVWSDSTNTDFVSSAENQMRIRASGGTEIYSNSALTAGVTLAAGDGSWASVSDRNVKENFRPVNGDEVLARLAAIPVSNWNYISQDDAVRHIGPMAQDFYGAFGVGTDDRHITAIDAEGVALAAIQALYQKTQEIDELKAELAEMRDVLAKMATKEK